MTNQQKQQNAEKDYAFLSHLLRRQKIYLCILLVLLSTAILISNYLQEKPLLMGSESYYYLSSARQELPYHPLTLLLKIIPEKQAYFLPPFLSLSIILLFYALAKKIKLSEKNMLFIVLFYVLTPTFLFTSMTASSYSLYLTLALLGTNLMLSSSNKKYLAAIPFFLASYIDTFSAILLLAGISGYSIINKDLIKNMVKKERLFLVLLNIIVAVSLVFNAAVLNASFFIGTFSVQHRATDFISDLGSFYGAGVFALMLAVIGLILNWQGKKRLLIILALVIFTASYFLNTHTVFFLSLLIITLAASGIVKLWEQNWKLPSLRNAVLLLLMLGIFFSAVSYLGRFSEYPPTSVDQKALQWIERHTDDEAIVLSAPENSYYISYFAKRTPALALHQNYHQQYNLSQKIFTAYYITELFPLLEQNKVSLVYVSEEMKRALPQDQEFLFLLQNERFKLLNFTGDAEVWSFEEAKQ